jgi:hypothetical protein
LVDVVVVDVCVEEGFDACFEAEFRVVYFAAGFDELSRSIIGFVGKLEVSLFTLVMPTPRT